MAGIEEAFEKFVTRVSGREKSRAEQPLSKYKSYSEQELLENIESKYPNQLQSFSLEDHQLNTMPMFEPKDVAPPRSYSPMPNIYYDTPRLSQVDLADGGVASMFRERPGYAEGGDIRNIIKQFEEKGITPSSFSGPNGIKFELVTGRFSGTPRYTPIYPEGYDFSKFGAIGGGYTEFEPEDFFKSVMAPEGTYFDYEKNDFLPMVSTPEVPTVDPFSLSYDPNDPKNLQEQAALKAFEEQNRRDNLLGKTFPEGYFDPATYEIPTVNPFSGEQVSAQVTIQDLIDANKEMSAKAPPGYGFSEEGLRKNADDDAGRLQSMMEAFNSGFYNNAPTVDPFSGQQISMQDQMAFTQPQQNIFQQPSPVDQFIGERRFQAEADAAARSGIPFTKTKDDYFSDLGLTAYGKTAFDAFNQIGLTPAKQTLVNQALSSAPGIGRALLGEIGGGFKSIPGGVGLGEYVGQGLRSLGQAATLNNVNLGVNPAVGGGTLGSRVLGSLIGAPAIYATALFNPTTMGNAELTPAMRSQQEAAARVTPTRMAYGGRVSMSDGGLTTTIAPAKGPDSQGVESLFRRRYN